jgi:hypothetical protein
LKHFFFVISLLLIFGQIALTQENCILSGHIADSLTGEPLIGATVYLVTVSAGIQTDAEGNFRIMAKKGEQLLRISYVGYHTREIALQMKGDTHIEQYLNQQVTETGAVVVTARNRAENTESTKTGFIEITGKEIRKLPTLMGEPDLIRTLYYSPGVQSANDGNSGFYVRGGNVDQNLILLDNAIVYNPSHVLGFFSVFNSDIVSSATLIKSGIPANYGGRISSVLAVKSVEGDFEKHSVSATLGLIYSKVMLQGPLIKNKLSYIVSYRRSYVDEILKPVLGLFMHVDSGSILNGTRYGMYDLNAKLSYKQGSRNRFSLMAYKGNDNFTLDRRNINYKSKINWGNTLLALNWNYVINDSSYLASTLNFSNYQFEYNSDQFVLGINLYSSIKNLNYKLEYTRNDLWKGSFKAGIEARFYRFVPNRFSLTVNNVGVNFSSYQNLYADELAGFASWEKDVTRNLRFYGGIRLTSYSHLGPYQDFRRTTEGTILDTIHYARFENIKTYTGLEPRLSVRWQTGPSASVKASYTRNLQFIHVASASAVTMPSDIWIPSTSHTRPQYGDQVTLGYYRNFGNNDYTASVEAYYKSLKNQVELLYGFGASVQDVSFENSLTTGKGYATGIEFYLQKHVGRFTGWIGYSLSYSERQFNEINEGNPFPAKYDRRHEANLIASFKPNTRWDFSMAFIYATGNCMTVPVQMYLLGGNILTEYGKTNAFRMPPYHRMDISATRNFKPRGRFESSLNFSVFNVYNRANPFLIYFDIQGDIFQNHNLSISAKQISIFPIMPSISWNLKF